MDILVGLSELGLIGDVSVAVVDKLAIRSLLVDLCAMLVDPCAHQHAIAVLHCLVLQLRIGGDLSRQWQEGAGVNRGGGRGVIAGIASFLSVAVLHADRVPLDVAIIQVGAHDVHMRVVTAQHTGKPQINLMHTARQWNSFRERETADEYHIQSGKVLLAEKWSINFKHKETFHRQVL